jgi:uroporphyrinogen III methyltransferase/synthase
MVGIVYLVGAGPGDPKLITVKGLECVKKADVIVYDRLASPRLLSYARQDAELIYVGKAPDRHTLRQNEINQVLVNKALAGKTVTRLKGGDPFVFGRGGEEAEALLEHNILFEVVPGISSAVAVPAYAGIPVTHRDFTSSFAVITGNEDPLKTDSTIARDTLATGVGTLVFLMGMRNLAHIVEKLMEHGCSPETPIALIRWGTRPEQQTLAGSLGTIVELAKQAELKHPVIIIVGEVVKLRDKLKWFENKPLFGKRVVVTRSRSQASVFAEAIENLGGEPWEFPTISVTDPDDYTPMDIAIKEIEKFNWIIFTSVNGVEYFFRRLANNKRDLRDLKGIKLCAIGPKTREELEKRGLNCDYVPEEYRAEAIISGLEHLDLTDRHILLPRADIARRVLPVALANLGAQVTEVDAYKTVLGEGNGDIMRELFLKRKVHILTFTSSSTVKNFVKILNAPDYLELLAGVTVACIGPITADTARELGLRVDIEAKQYTIPGLLQAIIEYVCTKEGKTWNFQLPD